MSTKTQDAPEYQPDEEFTLWPPEFDPDDTDTVHDYWCNCRPCTRRAADAWADAIAPLVPPF